MALPNVFDTIVIGNIINRIQRLSPQSAPLWGKMNVAQMLAHCCVTYEFIFEPGKHSSPSGFMKFILKWMVKPTVVNEKPYKKSSQTAPAFIITDTRDFEKEQQRLIQYIQQTQQLGAQHFEGKASHSFGNLTAIEWNNMFYKHLDHHLTQFGV